MGAVFSVRCSREGHPCILTFQLIVTVGKQWSNQPIAEDVSHLFPCVASDSCGRVQALCGLRNVVPFKDMFETVFR